MPIINTKRLRGGFRNICGNFVFKTGCRLILNGKFGEIIGEVLC